MQQVRFGWPLIRWGMWLKSSESCHCGQGLWWSTVGCMARRVVLVVFPDIQLLDLVGPLEVFSMADRFSDSEVSEYVTEVVSPDGGVIRASSGLEIGANRAIGACGGRRGIDRA